MGKINYHGLQVPEGMEHLAKRTKAKSVLNTSRPQGNYYVSPTPEIPYTPPIQEIPLNNSDNSSCQSPSRPIYETTTDMRLVIGRIDSQRDEARKRLVENL